MNYLAQLEKIPYWISGRKVPTKRTRVLLPPKHAPRVPHVPFIPDDGRQPLLLPLLPLIWK